MKNVVLLTIDTFRKDMLGCYGNRENLTPFLDKLAKKSVVFNKAVSTAPYTQASFPAILASSYFLEYGNPQMLSSKRTLISQVLKAIGVSTAAVHSNAYLSEYFGWNRGWDYFYDSMKDSVTDMVPYITCDIINQKSTAWLSSRIKKSEEKPFFLWMHYMDLHEPYVPHEEYISQIDPSIKLSRQQMFDMFTNTVLPRDTSDSEKVRVLKKLYSAHVKKIDHFVNEFFTNLQSLDLSQNTTVIITADHGEEFADHGGLSHDGKMFSELIDVPLLIFDPEMAEQKTVDRLVSTIDISPTIAHLFGCESPEGYHGQSLLPLEQYVPKAVFGEAIGKLSHKVKPTDRPAHFYQEGDLRISHRIEDDQWQMYNLADDPKELKNIVNESGMADEMKNKLKAMINWYDQGPSPVINVTRF